MTQKGLVILTPNMECPNCRRRYHEGWADSMFPVCQSNKCRVRWWAMKIHEGDVFTQLQMTFGRDGAREIHKRLGFQPTFLGVPMFLQIVIAHEAFNKAKHEGLNPKQILNSLPDAA